MTGPANPLVTLLEGAYARWDQTKGGSAREVLELFADNVEMRSVLSPIVGSRLAGTHRSREQASDYFTALAEDWEMLHFEVDRFVADGDDVVMIGRCAFRHKLNGEEVATPKVDVWHFENGKATIFSEYFDTLGFATATGAAALV
jgi:ketosteroid isomerase-like protein